MYNNLQVLQEELRGQEPLYDKFIQSGNAVHDKCIPESKDAAHISEKMTVISKMWERLSDKLTEREKSLNSVEGLSKEFSDTLQELSGWMSDYMTTLDNLQPVTTTPEKHEDHLREIKVRTSSSVANKSFLFRNHTLSWHANLCKKSYKRPFTFELYRVEKIDSFLEF